MGLIEAIQNKDISFQLVKKTVSIQEYIQIITHIIMLSLIIKTINIILTTVLLLFHLLLTTKMSIISDVYIGTDFILIFLCTRTY